MSHWFRFRIGLLVLFLPLAGAQGDEKVRKDYVLKVGDGIALRVYNEPDLDTDTRVLKTGELSIPLLGSVPVEGMTIEAASARIYELYNADYLVEPKLTLSVTEYAPEYVDILGEVKRAGRVMIPATGRLDLASLFAMAGGFTPEADPNLVTVMKADGEVQKYNGTQASEAALQRVFLSSGDRVIVGKSVFVGRTFTVLGEVKSEGPYPFPLDGKLDLVAAIAAAGGLTDLANPKKVTLRRDGQTSQIDYQSLSRAGKSISIRSGDIIFVARRIF